jgi:RHH-type proline utilization regulon transcriptional repressor/proline dehydrogenase/delta 1-pyrroline-5-carboxylate dehydrogenase
MHMSDQAPTDLDFDSLANDAIKLAAEILRGSRKHETSSERSRSAMMARMMRDEPGKKFTMAMADEVLRMDGPRRAAKRMDSLINQYGVPKYFSALDRLAVKAGNRMAKLIPSFIMPKVTQKIRKDSAHVIISAAETKFNQYLQSRRNSKIRVNFNQLGEAVLGDHEADRRWNENIRRLKEPGVNYISVKLSAIASQISLTGYAQTLELLRERLRDVYRAAIEGGGSTGPKFVNLDMEEYRDLHLTVDVFQSVLEEPEFEKLEAGIVLQAYLPDSFAVLQSLTQWAKDRHARTQARIKIRIVKGANLAMEQVDAALHDWPQAPYESKVESDANFKRMLEFACRPENASVVRIGVASHNLFDVAFALLIRNQRGVESDVEFEMLEGMANAQATEVLERSGDMLLYAPVVLDAEFEAAVAYLIRRLDENTAPGSFLGALFSLEEGSAEWNSQSKMFLDAVKLSRDPKLSSTPNRTQNRLTEKIPPASADAPFHNAADTDFSLPANRKWAAEIVERWKSKQPDPIPVCVGDQSILEPLTGIGADPSRPGVETYRFAQATEAHVESALQTAVAAQPGWESLGHAGRAELLLAVGAEIARKRGETIGAMVFDAGKAIIEADVEITEAIDFANYYAQSLTREGWFDGTSAKAIGTVVVTPPWNFPFAIPVGGVLAALIAGNTVILKPANESVLTAWQIVEQLWAAGIPRDVLQFLPMEDGPVGKKLLTDSRVAAVVLTGSIFTAQLFQSWRPDMKLFAETSGKNCLIISASADLDLAVKDLVKGAFGHAGQKCSASSLALVEEEVYDSKKFRAQLVDAASSLRVAGSWDPSSIVTPVIREPDEALAKGLTELGDGETWLLEPKMIDGNPCLWSPGIRLGVKPGSWYHKNECFGPVLGLMRVEGVAQAVKIQNSSEFGLTGGLHSLDPSEIELWRGEVEVGNAYINRPTTGAIVQRQPFGGWKNSSVGPGSKAGGPNYVSLFCDWNQDEAPRLRESLSSEILKSIDAVGQSLARDELTQLKTAAESYLYWWNKEFSIDHDPSQIHGETNVFRYRARPWHLIRIQNDAIEDENLNLAIAKSAMAAKITGTQLLISIDAESGSQPKLENFSSDIVVETDQSLVASLAKLRGGSMRICGTFDAEIYRPAAIGNIPIFNPAVLSNGRLELLKYLREQSVTETIHRYGNIV